MSKEKDKPAKVVAETKDPLKHGLPKEAYYRANLDKWFVDNGDGTRREVVPSK